MTSMKITIWISVYFLQCVLIKRILGQDWLSYDANFCEVGTNACDNVHLDTLKAVLYARGNRYSYAMDADGADEAMANPDFNVNYETVIFVYGYISTNTSESASKMREAYAQYGGEKNFFLAFTENVFGGIFIDPTNYVRASQETVCVGERLGNFLIALHERNAMADKIHLIGHSLGAQTIHAAAQRFTSRVALKIRRLTGIDPAGPCFDPNHFIQLNSGDADLVDIIHTNAFALGTGTKLGSADFSPDGGIVQAGCGAEIGCSHGRGIDLYINSMRTDLCIAAPSTSLSDFTNNYKRQLNGDSVPMGYNWNGERGTFYLYTKWREPFCMGYAGINEDISRDNADTLSEGVGVPC